MQRNQLPAPLPRGIGDRPLPPSALAHTPDPPPQPQLPPRPGFLRCGEGRGHWSEGELLPPAGAGLGGVRTASACSQAADSKRQATRLRTAAREHLPVREKDPRLPDPSLGCPRGTCPCARSDSAWLDLPPTSHPLPLRTRAGARTERLGVGGAALPSVSFPRILVLPTGQR